jgi:hypothetical protein
MTVSAASSWAVHFPLDPTVNLPSLSRHASLRVDLGRLEKNNAVGITQRKSLRWVGSPAHFRVIGRIRQEYVLQTIIPKTHCMLHWLYVRKPSVNPHQTSSSSSS